MADRVPDHVPASEVAYQKALDAYAAAEAAAVEAGGYPVDLSTDAGQRAYVANHEAEVAWDAYHEAWADETYPETTPEAQKYLAELDIDLGPDEGAELEI